MHKYHKLSNKKILRNKMFSKNSDKINKTRIKSIKHLKTSEILYINMVSTQDGMIKSDNLIFQFTLLMEIVMSLLSKHFRSHNH